MAKQDRERLEITFGEKDADIWAYLESFGLPKASLVKNMIREKMNQQNSPKPIVDAQEVVQRLVIEVKSVDGKITAAVPISEEEVVEVVNDPSAEEQAVNEEPKQKKTSKFGGLSKKI